MRQDINIVVVGVDEDGLERQRLQFQAEDVSAEVAAMMLRDFADRLEAINGVDRPAPARGRLCSKCEKPGHRADRCPAPPQ